MLKAKGKGKKGKASVKTQKAPWLAQATPGKEVRSTTEAVVDITLLPWCWPSKASSKRRTTGTRGTPGDHKDHLGPQLLEGLRLIRMSLGKEAHMKSRWTRGRPYHTKEEPTTKRKPNRLK